MTSPEPPVLAVDGPGGSGKGTAGQLCARALGWHYLDSGAIYRALAYIVRKKNIDINDLDKILDAAREMKFECRPLPPEPAEIWVNGIPATDDLRGEEMGDLASRLAATAQIRSILLDLQRNARKMPGLVADGRDMGTIVFPHATLKIFLTASPEERAKRRYNQLKLKDFDVSLADLFQAIQERDARDSERDISPLFAAQDAVTIDSSDLGIDEVVTRILDLIYNQLEYLNIDSIEHQPDLTR